MTATDNTTRSRRAVASVARLLRRHYRCRVATQERAGGLWVYTVDGRCLDVQVRVASLVPHAHHVTVDGKTYNYRYARWSWNLHRHGKKTDADVWVLICGDTGETFIVPGADMAGKTYHLHVGRLRKAKIWPWRGAWEVVAGTAGRRAA